MIIILLLMGLCLGSFVNALVWRMRELDKPVGKRLVSARKLSITKGRSICTHCKHLLAWYDLVPVVSWIGLRGRCRYCHKNISTQYPVVELITATGFVVSYLFWPADLIGFEWIRLLVWLALLVALIALAVYDLRTMLLPNKLVFVAGIVVFLIVALQLLNEPSIHLLVNVALGAASFGGLFYALFQLSDGKWIGGGDVKLGFVLGAWLASPVLSLLTIFIASLTGTVVALIASFAGKASLKTRLPFGPLLIIGTFISTLFGQQLVDVYLRFLGGY